MISDSDRTLPPMAALIALIPVLFVTALVLVGGQSAPVDAVPRPPFPAFSWQEVTFVPRSDGSGTLFLTFNLYNFAQGSEFIDFAYGIVPDQPDAQPVYFSPHNSMTLEPSSPFTTTYRDVVTLPPGTYRVVGWVRGRDGDAETYIGDFTTPTVFTVAG